MKRNKILFALLASACVGMAAGCGETKYSITTKVNSSEESYIVGGGKYANGKKVSLKVYPTEGCLGTETNPAQRPRIEFTRQGATSVTDTFELTNLIDGKYYLYEFVLDNNTETGNVGTYNAICNCATRSSDEASDAKATKFKVTYTVKDNNGNVLKTHQEEVKYGGLATNIKGFDGLEGILKWYKDDDYNNEYLFRTEDTVTTNLNLFSKLEDSPKAIIEGALTSFKDAKNLEFALSDGTFAKVTSLDKYFSSTEADKKAMFFDYYKDSTTRDFFISDGLYYAFDGEAYFKADLNGNSFGMTIENLANFKKFLEHTNIDVETTGYQFIRETEEVSGVTQTKKYNIVVGQLDGEDIVVSCSKYFIKDAGNNTIWELYISGGKIYKTVKADGSVENVINYLEEGSKTNPQGTKNMYLIKLEVKEDDRVSASDLHDKVTEMNTKFETVLKIKQGETLKDVIQANTGLNDILKKYNYQLIKGANTPLPLNSTTAVSSNGTLYIDINASSQVVFDAVNVLNNGGFTVKTEMTWDGTVYDKTESFAVGSNVLSNLGSISNAIKDTLLNLRDLDTTTGYDSFSLNTDTSEYEFYDKDCSVPFLRVKINSTTGKIEQVTYYDFENVNVAQRNTYVSTFTYN